MSGKDAHATAIAPDHDAAVRAERLDDAIQQQLGDDGLADLPFRQQHQAHHGLELGRQTPLLVEVAGVLERARDLGRDLEDHHVGRPVPGCPSGADDQRPNDLVSRSEVHDVAAADRFPGDDRLDRRVDHELRDFVERDDRCLASA